MSEQAPPTKSAVDGGESPVPAQEEQSAASPVSAPGPAPAATSTPAPAHDAPLEAEEPGEDDDQDSTLGDELTDTTSLSSSIFHYRTINGRQYHSERGNAQYWVTNEDQSNEALDINHHVMTLLLDGKLHKAPLNDDMQMAVDIATGTGIWAIDFADEYPSTSVIGTDISVIQPSLVPPNLEFQIDDCTQEWTFEPNSLDYVHLRFLVGSVADWPALFANAYRCLKPGGYIESHEASPEIGSDDDTIADTVAMRQWGDIFFKGGKKIGRTFAILEDEVQRKGMEEAGFVDIEEMDLKVPIGGWPKDPTLKEAGRFFKAAILQDIEGTLNFIAALLGWSQDEITVFSAHYRREIQNRNIHAYFKQKIVWARKPLDA